MISMDIGNQTTRDIAAFNQPHPAHSANTQLFQSEILPVHGHNTRYQAKLGRAMNDPGVKQHLSKDMDLDPAESEPRLSDNNVATLSGGSSGSESSSEIDSDSEMEDVSLTSDSGNGSDAESVSASKSGEQASKTEETEAIEDAHEMDAEPSQSAEQSASEQTSEPAENNMQIIEIDFKQLLQHLGAKKNASGSLDKINDKHTFLTSLGINPEQNHETSENPELQGRADKLWSNFKSYNSSQFDLILGLDRFSISEMMGKIHVDPKIDAAQKKRLLEACRELNGLVAAFQQKDQDFKALTSTQLKPLTPPEQMNLNNTLRINAGELAKGLATLRKTQSMLQSNGLSLDVGDLHIAMESGLQVQRENKDSTITFADVVGMDEVKAELQDVVGFLKNPDAYNFLGATMPRGVLLSGPPGTGKTLLARAVANEAGVPFMSVTGSDFVEMYVGVGAQRVRELFQQANSHEACIVFIDELDAIGAKRSTRSDGGGQEHNQTLNQLLTAMNGFSDRSGVVVMAATNLPESLDPALTRPGRFDRNIAIPLPTISGREAILKLHGSKKKMADAINYNAIARRTTGFSGAELAGLIKSAVDIATRAGKTQIEQVDLESAYDRSIMGMEQPSFRMSDKNRLNTAYHESGHAIVSYLLADHDPVYKVTIMPRGLSLGATHYMPDEDTSSISLRQLKGNLCSLMGGRIAEELLLGDDGVTTGASNDLERASSIARKMVTKWGFSKALGPVVFGTDSSGKISSRTAEIIDQQVKEILVEAESSARDLLTKNRDKLDAMAQSLLKFEEIDAHQVCAIMNPSSMPTQVQDA